MEATVSRYFSSPSAGLQVPLFPFRLHSYSRSFAQVASALAHAGLGDMYVADPRFTEYYEKRAPGLAEFVKSAIHANRVRQEE